MIGLLIRLFTGPFNPYTLIPFGISLAANACLIAGSAKEINGLIFAWLVVSGIGIVAATALVAFVLVYGLVL